jgi:hypothetical protein
VRLVADVAIDHSLYERRKGQLLPSVTKRVAACRPVERIDSMPPVASRISTSLSTEHAPISLMVMPTELITCDRSDSAAVPLRSRNAVRVLAPLRPAPNHPLEEETPLFAADLDFALTHGGPLTRAFLESIPLDRHAGVVVDSSLVWLSPGLAHALTPAGPLSGPRGPVGFAHEPFPGVMTGVRGESNRNREAVHRLCVFGVDSTPEWVDGELAFATPAEAEEFWYPTESLAFREQEIARRLDEGSLRLTPLPLAMIVEFGWGTLLRPRPAATHGFQFIVRATSGDRRPHVNGLRNHAQL